MGKIKNLIKTKELAQLLKMHPQYIRDQARLGLIPSHKLGNTWLFNYDQVLKALESNAAKATQKAYSQQIKK